MRADQAKTPKRGSVRAQLVGRQYDLAAGSIPAPAAVRDCSGRGKGCSRDRAAPALSQARQGSSQPASRKRGENQLTRDNLRKLVRRLNRTFVDGIPESHGRGAREY